MLINPDRANSRYARFIRATVLAFQHFGKGVQRIARINRPHELYLVVSEIGDGFFRVVLHAE